MDKIVWNTRLKREEQVAGICAICQKAITRRQADDMEIGYVGATGGLPTG